jgi:hypothetical protein
MFVVVQVSCVFLYPQCMADVQFKLSHNYTQQRSATVIITNSKFLSLLKAASEGKQTCKTLRVNFKFYTTLLLSLIVLLYQGPNNIWQLQYINKCINYYEYRFSVEASRCPVSAFIESKDPLP